jgi:cephalosporin-C deacetylase-like acetyl esterase
MLRLGGLGLAGLAGSGLALPGLVDLAAAQERDQEFLNRFPRVMQDHYVRRVRGIEARQNEVRAALKTKEDAEKYVQGVRERIQRSFGPWPEKTPLNPQVIGVVERDAYRIEKVIFESRPRFFVTANLYIPKDRKFPLPGVVGSCGHSDNGKAAAAYQSFAQGLARLGYVCLIYDPLGQGERLQYTDEMFRPTIGVGTREHNQAGNQQHLVGEFLGSWRAWDGIRALDYLLKREEVDPQHVGITGNSGGGTMTTWLCGVEQRWTMAAPACFVTTLRRNLENELPADSEQCPPRVLALGLDHADFLAALAPKPVIILAKERDYFDARGAEEAFARLKHLYGLLGAEENVALHIGPTEHGYTQENREAMYRWFNRVTGISDASTEPALVIEEDKTLQCTPNGQVAELKSRPVYSFTQAKSRRLGQSRQRLEGDALREAIATVLRLPASVRSPSGGAAPEYRILRPHPSRGYPLPFATAYAVETEPGVQALVYRLSKERHLSRPPRGPKRAILYVSHLSSDLELRQEPLIKELCEKAGEATCFTVDVRGIGESLPNTCSVNSFRDSYGCDYFYAAYGVMLDSPVIGQRTLDVLRVLDFLNAYGHEEIHIAGKGFGAIAATFAAVLSDRVKLVTLKHALSSYAEVAETTDYRWPLSALVPRILTRFDLPDCYQALARKKLQLIEPVGAEGVPV